MFRIPPPYLWTPLSPQRVKGCSPLTIPKMRSKRKKASRCAKTGCGSQRLLRCRSHPAGRGPNSSSLFPPLAAVVAVAPRGRGTGEPGRPMLDEQSFFILKTAVPCYRGQQLRNNILVKLLLISVAGHSFLRYIELSAGSRKLPGLPKPLLQGEVARRRRDGEVVQRRACPL